MSEDNGIGKKAGKVAPKKGALLASPQRKKRQVALGAVLAPLMQPALARQGVVLAQIAPHWRAICPLLAEYSCPESVRGDILTVAVANDGVKQELHYITPQIIEGVARLLGYAAVAKVRGVTRHDLKCASHAAPVRTVPAKTSAEVSDKVESLCKSVRDDDLRAALNGLGSQLLKTTTKKA